MLPRVCLFTGIIIICCFVIQEICTCFDFEVTRISFFDFVVVLFLSLFEGFEKSFLEVEELA